MASDPKQSVITRAVVIALLQRRKYFWVVNVARIVGRDPHELMAHIALLERAAAQRRDAFRARRAVRKKV